MPETYVSNKLSDLDECRETLMRIGAELGLSFVTAHNAIDAIRVLKQRASGQLGPGLCGDNGE